VWLSGRPEIPAHNQGIPRSGGGINKLRYKSHVETIFLSGPDKVAIGEP
jgi:hypothetical protein